MISFKEPISRRGFFGQAARSGLGVAAAGALCAWGYDPVGPRRLEADAPEVALKDFSIPHMAPTMAVVTGADRVLTFQRALAALGGIAAFVSPGQRVLLKVNAAFAAPAALCATTHPDLVAETARQCYAAGARSVAVTDNPINDPATCFRLSGIAEAAAKAGARVFYPDVGAFRPTTVSGGGLIRGWPLFYTPFEGIDRVIGLAPVKDHQRAGASMTMKNWYGLLGGRRNVFHQQINDVIMELAMMVKPSLVILDGTYAMMRNGPTGGSLDDLKATHTLIAGTDQVAVDAFGATLLGKTAADLPYIGKAQARGVGNAEYERLKLIRDHVD
jgi:uncharacterized protein (DUF362 family)